MHIPDKLCKLLIFVMTVMEIQVHVRLKKRSNWLRNKHFLFDINVADK